MPVQERQPNCADAAAATRGVMMALTEFPFSVPPQTIFEYAAGRVVPGASQVENPDELKPKACVSS